MLPEINCEMGVPYKNTIEYRIQENKKWNLIKKNYQTTEFIWKKKTSKKKQNLNRGKLY